MYNPVVLESSDCGTLWIFKTEKNFTSGSKFYFEFEILFQIVQLCPCLYRLPLRDAFLDIAIKIEPSAYDLVSRV